MKKQRLLSFAVLCTCFLPVLAYGAPAVTVSASAVDILGTAQTISLTVTLIDPNQTGNLRVSGTGILPIMVASTVTPGTTATVGPIYGNDVIVNGLGTTNSTYYDVKVFTVTNGIIASTASLEAPYQFTGSGTIDLSTATPMLPNSMAGTGGNVSIPGNLSITGSETVTGSLAAGAATLTSVNNKVMADQYASLSAAITALGGSGVVELPCGPNGTQKTYTVSSTITIASDGVQIFGHGLCSNISVTTTSDVFQVTGALFQLRDLNVTIGTSTSRNGSAIVHPTNSTGSQGLIQNVRFVGNASSTDNGIILLEDQTGTGLWRGSQWRIIGGFTWQAAVKLAHSSTLSTIASNQFDDISGSAGFTDAGFAFDGLIDTVTISNIDLEPNVTGSGPVLWLRNTLNGSGSGGAPRWVNCIACLPSNATASSTGPSVVLDSSRDFHMIGGTLAGPNDGLKIGSQAADTVISGVQFVNIGQNAIHVVSGSINTIITQNTFTDVCDTSGTFDVIAVDAGTTDFQITNNTLRVLFSSFKCRDGVNIASGTSNHYVVANNDFPSSALNTSQLVNAGTGADQVVSGMLGGTSTINRAPVQVASVDLTSQTAAIATTTLYTVVTAGQYRLSWDAKVTTAAGTSSTLGGLTIVYTDPDGSNVPSSVVGAMVSGGGVNTTATTNNTLTGLWGLPIMMNCKAGTNITYAMAYASNPANAMNYNLHIVLEKM